jgi:hypothetical protein
MLATSFARGRAYKCNWSCQGRLHTNTFGIRRCHNLQIRAELLEAKVLAMVKEVMLDPPGAAVRRHAPPISGTCHEPT